MGFVKPFCRGGAEPCPYNLPRKKVISIKISTVPSIDGRYSTATSYKSDTQRIRRRAAETRRVTIEWNDAQSIDARLNSEAGCTQT